MSIAWLGAVVLICLAIVTLARAMGGEVAEVIASFALDVMIVGVALTATLGLSVFLFARPNAAIPPGLRDQPGVLWDRRPVIHRAVVTEVEGAAEGTYFFTTCECGWTDAPFESEPAAHRAARRHTSSVEASIERVSAGLTTKRIT